MTSNVSNQGIAHAAFRAGGEPLCKSRRAHFTCSTETFRTISGQCKRCIAKLAKSDAVKAKNALRQIPKVEA